MAARLPNTIAILRKRPRPMFAITLIANRGAIPAFSPAIPAFSPVIPAKAGIQKAAGAAKQPASAICQPALAHRLTKALESPRPPSPSEETRTVPAPILGGR